VCSRCRSLSQPCIWPRRQKRGPAKGYIEALEIRLKETERLLWRLLSVSTDDTLSAAFSDLVSDQIPESLAVRTLGTTEEKKSAIAYWEQFPLQNANDVRLWRQDLESAQDSISSRFGNVDQDILLRQPDAASHTGSSPGRAEGEVSLSLLPGDEDTLRTGFTPHRSVETPPINQDSPGGSIGQADAFVSGDQSQASKPGRSVATSKFGLSKEFQATFLW